MGHKGGENDGGHNHPALAARAGGEEFYDGVEQADFIHQGEVGDGEHEQNGGGEHGFHAGSDKTADLLGAEPGDDRRNQRQADERHRRADPAFDEHDHQDCHQHKTNDR